MRPSLHPHLVNGRFGDPALFVEVLHRRDALLFDMGDLSALSARDLLRIGHIFVSHMHMDHFIGFDALLRVNVGREKRIRIAGPVGLCERLHHKLQGYEWDLAHRYDADLVFEAIELVAAGSLRSASFRFKERFAWSATAEPWWPLEAGQGLKVEHALLEHHGPCIGYALEEQAHANVWPNRVKVLGLAPGPWLNRLKQAVLSGAGDEEPIALPNGQSANLSELRSLVSVSRGQKIAYVTDVADTGANRDAIAALARDADAAFIESRFAAEDREQADARAHLTTAAAGEIGRAAGARKLEPFHFSPRYDGQEAAMLAQVAAAFAGEPVPPLPS